MKKQLLWKGHAIAKISTNEEGNMVVYNPDIQKINIEIECDGKTNEYEITKK